VPEEPATTAPNQPGQPGFDPELSTDEAPYGWLQEKHGSAKGTWRPRKLRGAPSARVRRGLGADGTPALEDLKAAHHRRKPGADRPPGHPQGRRRPRRPDDGSDLPPYKEGVITTGVNRLYARAGKIYKTWDIEVGEAILATTRKEAPDDMTVGEAWDQVAKTNPRIRRFWMKAIAGGAWGALFYAHAPILLALLMKDAIRRRLPLANLAQAIFEPADDGQPSEATKATGLGPEDLQQMMEVSARIMQQMGLIPPGRAPNQPRGPATVIITDPNGQQPEP
jgi:hypothetical protein